MWKLNMNGPFTLKIAYQSIDHDERVLSNSKWKLIWDNKLPPKVKCFLWLVKKGRLLTNHERVRRKIASDAACARCGVVQKIVLHVLRDFSFTKAW